MAGQTDSLYEALQGCLDIVCKLTNWPVGHVYLPEDNGEQLRPTSIWHLDDVHTHAQFKEVTDLTKFKKGIGLPGRIWDSGEPAWIRNVTKDANFPRAQLCDEIGVQGAFGFPIKIRNELVAVLEFFSPEEMAPDENLLTIVSSLGEQVGRVIERKHDRR